mgnify:CR=1 FL=1
MPDSSIGTAEGIQLFKTWSRDRFWVALSDGAFGGGDDTAVDSLPPASMTDTAEPVAAPPRADQAPAALVEDIPVTRLRPGAALLLPPCPAAPLPLLRGGGARGCPHRARSGRPPPRRRVP